MISAFVDALSDKSAHLIVVEESICIVDMRGLSVDGFFPPISQFNGLLFGNAMVNVFWKKPDCGKSFMVSLEKIFFLQAIDCKSGNLKLLKQLCFWGSIKPSVSSSSVNAYSHPA